MTDSMTTVSTAVIDNFLSMSCAFCEMVDLHALQSTMMLLLLLLVKFRYHTEYVHMIHILSPPFLVSTAHCIYFFSTFIGRLPTLSVVTVQPAPSHLPVSLSSPGLLYAFDSRATPVRLTASRPPPPHAGQLRSCSPFLRVPTQ